MRSFIEHVNQEICEIQQLIAKEERNIRNAPNGSLRISQSHGRFQCYHITKDKPVNGVFLKRSQEHLIADLAQKSYDKKVLRSSRRMLAGLLRLRGDLPDVLPEDVYKTLHPLRRSLVRPVLLPEEDFVKAWEEERWHGKYIDPDGPQLFTEKGELVRSKSEIIIANTLYHLGIPYRYECALDLNDITVYPDFTVLHIKQRQVKYLEHFGMMADYDYYTKAVNRISLFAENGIVFGDSFFFTVNYPPPTTMYLWLRYSSARWVLHHLVA